MEYYEWLNNFVLSSSFLFPLLSLLSVFLLFCRIQSIAESRDELPCSLLLVTAGDDREEGEKVVGHARLLQVAGCRDAALVESVVVSAKMRRRGLGRRLMESCEQHARKCVPSPTFSYIYCISTPPSSSSSSSFSSSSSSSSSSFSSSSSYVGWVV